MNQKSTLECKDWSIQELLASRDQLKRDYWEATRILAGITKMIVDIDAEIVARNLTPTDTLQ